MKIILHKLYFNSIVLLRLIKRKYQVNKDLEILNKQEINSIKRFPRIEKNKIILNENSSASKLDRHYFFHTAWASRVLEKKNPSKHVDISSLMYFSGIASAFVPVEFYEYRPANISISNLKSKSADIKNLPFKKNSVNSLSCMHVVEHIGLGRYGDEIDYDGDLKAMKELQRVLAPNGHLLFVVPIGIPKIVFNAHRIYSIKQIVSAFDKLHLEEFVLIPDSVKDGNLVTSPSKKLLSRQRYGCGCFLFTKIMAQG
jgi:SAM-dependent methyltransferase